MAPTQTPEKATATAPATPAARAAAVDESPASAPGALSTPAPTSPPAQRRLMRRTLSWDGGLVAEAPIVLSYERLTPRTTPGVHVNVSPRRTKSERLVRSSPLPRTFSSLQSPFGGFRSIPRPILEQSESTSEASESPDPADDLELLRKPSGFTPAAIMYSAILIVTGLASMLFMDRLRSFDATCVQVVTALQLLLTAMFSFNSNALTQPSLPWSRVLFLGLLNAAPLLLANHALDYGLPLWLVHTLRNGIMVSGLLMKWFVSGIKPSTRQIIAAISMCIGITTAVLSITPHSVGTTPTAGHNKAATGLVLVLASLLVQSGQNVYQEKVLHEAEVKPDDVLLYSNFWALPLFALVPHVGESVYHLLADWQLVATALVGNLVCSLVYRIAVMRLMAATSGAIVTLMSIVYRAFFLVLSVFASSHPAPGLSMWLGIIVVLVSAAAFMLPNRKIDASYFASDDEDEHGDD